MKKVLLIVMCMTLMLGVLCACAEKPAETPADAPAEKLVMGTNAAFPPYEFVDDNNKIVGIDAEIADAVAKKMGKELEIKDMEFDSLITAVAGGSIDFALAGMTVTDERLQSVNFSDTYAKGVQVIVVKEGSDIKTADDLSDKITIGVQAGTTGDIYCTDDFGQDSVKQYTNGALAIAALTNGQVDCVVIDNEPAKAFVQANKGLVILETAYAEEDYAAAIKKENTQLLADFNKALAELKADGTIDAIIEKYIPTDAK